MLFDYCCRISPYRPKRRPYTHTNAPRQKWKPYKSRRSKAATKPACRRRTRLKQNTEKCQTERQTGRYHRHYGPWSNSIRSGVDDLLYFQADDHRPACGSWASTATAVVCSKYQSSFIVACLQSESPQECCTMGFNGVITHKHSLPRTRCGVFGKGLPKKQKCSRKKKRATKRYYAPLCKLDVILMSDSDKTKNTHQGKTKRGRKPNSGISCPF